jgi:hypothetical protein
MKINTFFKLPATTHSRQTVYIQLTIEDHLYNSGEYHRAFGSNTDTVDNLFLTYDSASAVKEGGFEALDADELYFGRLALRTIRTNIEIKSTDFLEIRILKLTYSMAYYEPKFLFGALVDAMTQRFNVAKTDYSYRFNELTRKYELIINGQKYER